MDRVKIAKIAPNNSLRVSIFSYSQVSLNDISRCRSNKKILLLEFRYFALHTMIAVTQHACYFLGVLLLSN